MYLWSVATGNIEPFLKESRDAARFIASLNGFTAVHPEYPGGTLWLFDSENHAKTARNLMESEGIECGRNICRFIWDTYENVLIQDFVPE